MTNKAAKVSIERFVAEYGLEDMSPDEIVVAYKKARRVWHNLRGTFYLLQKLVGVFFLVSSYLLYLICPEDAGYIIFTVPLGLYLIFSKRYFFYDSFSALDQIMNPDKYKHRP